MDYRIGAALPLTGSHQPLVSPLIAALSTRIRSWFETGSASAQVGAPIIQSTLSGLWDQPRSNLNKNSTVLPRDCPHWIKLKLISWTLVTFRFKACFTNIQRSALTSNQCITYSSRSTSQSWSHNPQVRDHSSLSMAMPSRQCTLQPPIQSHLSSKKPKAPMVPTHQPLPSSSLPSCRTLSRLRPLPLVTQEPSLPSLLLPSLCLRKPPLPGSH